MNILYLNQKLYANNQRFKLQLQEVINTLNKVNDKNAKKKIIKKIYNIVLKFVH